jgi:hypothetical protein
MDVNILTPNNSNSKPQLLVNILDPCPKIIPKHKKSNSNILKLNKYQSPAIDTKYFSASTPKKIVEAYYKKKEIFDIEFNLELNKNFKENLEIKQKRLLIEERKRKEEEFAALKEAKIKIKQEEAKRNFDDLKREQDKLKIKQDLIIEKKKIDTQFKQEKRNFFIEYTLIKKKTRWQENLKARDFSLDNLRIKPCLD